MPVYRTDILCSRGTRAFSLDIRSFTLERDKGEDSQKARPYAAQIVSGFAAHEHSPSTKGALVVQ